MRALRMTFLVGLCSALLAACRSETPELDPPAADLAAPADLSGSAPDAAGPPGYGPAVACGSELPGPPLKADVTEAQPGYAEELAALELSSVADPFDYSAESKLAITVINYMLGRAQGTSIAHREAMERGGLGRAVLGAAAKGTAGRIDLSFLRRGLHYFYPCTRPLPADLPELRRRYGDYRTWTAQEIACSRPKNGPRRLYENPGLGVYVAEAVVQGSVRETEVIFTSLRTDGQLDFASYTAEGALSDRSTFATSGGGTSTLAAPYACISCHVDITAGRISRLLPTGTGAGCR